MAHDPSCCASPRRSLASLTDEEKKTLFAAAFGEPIDGQSRNDWLTPGNSIGLMGQTRQGTKILTVFADGYIHGEMSAVGAPFHTVRVVRYLDSLRIGWAGIDYPATEPTPPLGPFLLSLDQITPCHSIKQYMPKFITVLVEGQPELVNVDHIQRVRRVGQESCQLIVGYSRPDLVPLGGSTLLIDESYEAIVKRITQAHG